MTRRHSIYWRLGILLIINGPSLASSATLTGNFTAHSAGASIELTDLGPVDWIHWGRFTEFAYDHKAVGTTAISGFSILGNPLSSEGPFRRSDLSPGCSWQDGLQNLFATNTTAGVYIIGRNKGFHISAPADLTPRILRVYVAADEGNGVLTATLSDNSATAYTNVAASSTAGFYALEYSTDSPDQTLTVTWTGATNSSVVTLQAATLAFATNNNPPAVTLVSPELNANLPVSATHALQALASDSDGTVSLVEFFADAIKIGESTSSPISILWTNPPVGMHVITARATDDHGATAISKPIEVFVHTVGGVLLGRGAAPPSTVSLSDEGTNDWTHWGLASATSINRKTGVAPQIGDLKAIGPRPVLRYADNLTRFNWTDGVPTASATDTPTGIYVFGLTNGFELTLPASPQLRTVKVYVGLYAARANFQAWLSDASTPAFTDTTLNNHYNNTYRVYTLQYVAASENQTLTIRHTAFNSHDTVFGNVTWQAVTLSGLPVPPAAGILLLNPEATADAFNFSFATEVGPVYAVEFTDALPPTNWMPLTNFAGSGGIWIVTDLFAPGITSRFYRVRRP
jgi:hypothetical protein